MQMQTLGYLAITPELFMLFMACTVLLGGVFMPHLRRLPYYLAQFTLLTTMLMTWWIYVFRFDQGIVYLFDNAFVLDHLAIILKLFICLVTAVVFVFTRHYNDERFIPQTEYYALGLLSVLGMMILVSSHNLLPLYLGLELFSLPIYAMVAIQRAKARCIEAAMKYFIIGAVASGMLLYGFSLLFGVTQSLDLNAIEQAILHANQTQNLLVLFALVFVIAGVAFKLGAAPFHMWVPDVYDGAPTSVTLFLSSAPKLAAFGLAIRLLFDALPPLHVEWQQILIVVAVLSIAIGNVVAIVQTNIKRLLAYSSIAHIGYMTLGLACGTQSGEAAAMFYMVSYTVMTLGAFGMVSLMSNAGVDANELSDYAGLSSRNPFLALMMLFIMFSLAGVPPIVGFMAKLGILKALLEVHLVWLAVLAIVFAIVGAYYYINVVKVMYFQEPITQDRVYCSRDAAIAMGVTGMVVLLLGIFPGALFTLCHSIFVLA